MIKKCIGCGVKLQSLDKLKDGYVGDLEKDYCERCFKMMHYHELANPHTIKDNKSIISKIKKNSFVIFCLDFININDEVRKLYESIRESKIILIMKKDIIPESVKYSKIVNYLKDVWNVKEPIISTDKYHYSFRNIENYIPRGIRNIYVLGPTNVGKSSFINAFLNSLGFNGSLTVSEMPNTTLDWIKIPTNNYTIYDSVGFSYINNYDKNIIKNSNIKKEIKPLTIQKNNASLRIDDIGFIKTSNNDSITWFGSDKIKVSKYFDELKYDFEIEVPSNTNIFIRGLGFLYFKNSDKVAFSNINKDNIIVSSSFIGGYNGQD